MKKKSNLISQIKSLQPLLLTVYVPTFIFIGLVWFATQAIPIAAYFLTADPAEIAKQPPYVGIVSNLGLVVWAASLASCWISAEVIKRDLRKQSIWQSFFFFSGIITALLMFDDLLQIHEQSHVYLQFLSHDGAELTVFSIYGMLILYYIVTFRNLFKKTDYLILLLALGFFVISLVFDVNPERINLKESNRSVLLEEGAKFLGIVSWLTYFARTCLSKLKYNNEQEISISPSDSSALD